MKAAGGSKNTRAVAGQMANKGIAFRSRQGRGHDLGVKSKPRACGCHSPDREASIPFVDLEMRRHIQGKLALAGLSDMGDAAEYFLGLGVKACVFTLGEDGAYYHDSSGTVFTLPAFDVDVKCTCGCGDAFNAGFAVGLVRGFDAETTVRFAQATAALNATGLGSQAGVVSFDHTMNFATTARTRRS